MKDRSSRNQRGAKHITLPDRIIERGLTYVNTENEQEEEMKEPVVDGTIEEENQAPYVIVVHGPIKVAKSTLIKSLVKHYSGRDETSELLLGNGRRTQFVECPNNVNGLIDAAKYSDAETFELLNMLRVHDIPKIIGVLTFVDGIGNNHKIAKHLRDEAENFYAYLVSIRGCKSLG
ncbi:hypothetical protein C5167_036031 [Papaver somniferum]|nr:hypothetical protein C5167_036031 [Papaver somniferum]